MKSELEAVIEERLRRLFSRLPKIEIIEPFEPVDRNSPTHEELCRAVHYVPSTGHFFRKDTGKEWKRIGRRCRSYIFIHLWGRQYSAGRLAWKIMTGSWPSKLVDHRNGIGTDNRWENLRLANHQENAWNSSGTSATGHKHVYRRKNSYKVQLTTEVGRIERCFKRLEDALHFRDTMLEATRGEFATTRCR